MPIGKDSIQKRVAKNTATAEPTPVAEPVVEVVEEAKALNIPTITPNEIERMKALWNSNQ